MGSLVDLCLHQQHTQLYYIIPKTPISTMRSVGQFILSSATLIFVCLLKQVYPAVPFGS